MSKLSNTTIREQNKINIILKNILKKILTKKINNNNNDAASTDDDDIAKET